MSSTCCIAPTSCIDLTSVDGGIRASPIISSNADNALTCTDLGLTAPVLQVPTLRVARGTDVARSPANVNPIPIVWDATSYNLGGWTVGVSPNAQLIAPEDGAYLVGCDVIVLPANVSTGRYGCSIQAQRAVTRLTGGTFIEVACAQYGDSSVGAPTQDVHMTCAGVLWMERGDGFQVAVFTSATANITVRTGTAAWAVKLP